MNKIISIIKNHFVAIIVMITFTSYITVRNYKYDEGEKLYSISNKARVTKLRTGWMATLTFHYNEEEFIIKSNIDKNCLDKIQNGNSRLLIEFLKDDPNKNMILCTYKIPINIEIPENGWTSIPHFQ